MLLLCSDLEDPKVVGIERRSRRKHIVVDFDCCEVTIGSDENSVVVVDNESSQVKFASFESFNINYPVLLLSMHHQSDACVCEYMCILPDINLIKTTVNLALSRWSSSYNRKRHIKTIPVTFSRRFFMQDMH